MILLPLSIQDFFDWCGEVVTSFVTLITSVVNLVINLVTGLLDFIKLLPTVVAMLSASVGNLPKVVIPFATVSITIAITLLILGRSNDT